MHSHFTPLKVQGPIRGQGGGSDGPVMKVVREVEAGGAAAPALGPLHQGSGGAMRMSLVGVMLMGWGICNRPNRPNRPNRLILVSFRDHIQRWIGSRCKSLPAR